MECTATILLPSVEECMNNVGRIALAGAGGLAVAKILSAIYKSPLEKQHEQARARQQQMLEIMQTTTDPFEYEVALETYRLAEQSLRDISPEPGYQYRM